MDCVSWFTSEGSVSFNTMGAGPGIVTGGLPIATGNWVSDGRGGVLRLGPCCAPGIMTVGSVLMDMVWGVETIIGFGRGVGVVTKTVTLSGVELVN